MMSEAFVYLWYDAPNDMYYLGKHKGSPDDTYTHSSTIWESFTKDNIPEGVTRRILAYGTDEEMCVLEHELLVNRKKRCWNRYYNKSLGDPRYVDQSGENHHFYGVTGKDHPLYGRTSSEETKKKLSKSIKQFYIDNPDRRLVGEKNGMYGKTHDELGTKFSDRHGENNSFYGKTHSEEHKQKYMYGENNPRWKGGFYSSINGPYHTSAEYKAYKKKYDAELYARKKAERQGEGTLKAFLG